MTVTSERPTLSTPAPSSDWPRLREWTVEEYDRLADQGYFIDQRVELVDGKIIQMAPQGERHVIAIALATRAIYQMFPDKCLIRPPAPLHLGERSKPEPDLAVVAGGLFDSLSTGTPKSASLVIEVSDSTLKYDRGTKAWLYAKSGIADYWIINLVDEQVEVHREPVKDDTIPAGYRYSSIRICRGNELISPLAAPEKTITPNDLIPPRSKP